MWKHSEGKISKYSVSDTQQVASFGEGVTIMRQRFPVAWFEDPLVIDFEGHPMPVPRNYDEYLRISYGDYMQLPPEEEQICRHDTVFIDLEHGYAQYKGIYYCVNSKKS
jgi:lipopolysaccharide cholinephosphotransferase